MVKIKLKQGKFTIEIKRPEEKPGKTIDQFIEWLVRLTEADEIVWERPRDYARTTIINGEWIEIKVENNSYTFLKPFVLKIGSQLYDTATRQTARRNNLLAAQQQKKERQEIADKARQIMSSVHSR